MDEERKQELEKEIENLTKTAFELSQTIQRGRTELEKLKLEKDAFLNQRLQEESLLLQEIRQELVYVRKQVKLNNEYIAQEKNKLIQDKNSVEQERRNVAVLKEEVEKERIKHKKIFIEASEIRNTCQEALEELLIKDKEITKLVKDSEEKNRQARFNQERLKRKENELNEWEIKIKNRVQELSDWELKLKNREKEVDYKLKESKRLHDEATKLIMWHKESKKL